MRNGSPSPPAGTPRATYRLQLRPGFGFAEAAGLAAYLADLGVSHVYLSPVLRAVPGSLHGYDVVDPREVNPGLGGRSGFDAMVRELAAHGLGIVLDVVPNHMAVSPENPWWWDVMENGPSSRWAATFDVDWEPPETRLRNLLLLPVLGDHYGRILERGELRLEREGGTFRVRYHEHSFPAAPRSLPPILAAAAARGGGAALSSIAEAYDGLPLPTATDARSVRRRHRDKEVLARRLARLLGRDRRAAAAVDAVIAETNADPDALDRFLERQNYRLAYWRSAARDLGYRRFFDVDTLVALRVEDRAVFTDTHALVLEWVAAGAVQGIRVDHVDGLLRPEAYLRRLRRAAPGTWIVVEKILAPDEPLPASWPVAGTTGYDFMNRVGGLFVDPAGEGPLTELLREFTGIEADFPAVALEKKRAVLTDLLGSDLNRLAALFVEVCEGHRRYRDYTRHELHLALREVAARLPVYRTYADAGSGTISPRDAALVRETVDRVKEDRSDLDPALFDFLGGILRLEVRGEREGELAMRFQQLTGPATAKGIEDTAFYCYPRLLALNEVGGDPGRFGVTVGDFHRAAATAAAAGFRGMIATGSHDTKRGEDARARLALLSEIPERWGGAVRRWAARNERHRSGDLPDRELEYFCYQTLVGAWPIEAERFLPYLEKAVREAKRLTSWRRPDPAYEEAVRRFAEGVLGDPAMRAELDALVGKLEPFARVNALAQKLLALTAPGVPDLYRGTELWDLNLVDPDNRRPVDWDARRRLLAAIEDMGPEDALARADEGAPKLLVVREALRLRARRPECFAPDAAYRPLEIRGGKAGHAIAFLRGEGAITVAPRLVIGRGESWEDTRMTIPAGRWRDLLTGEDAAGGEIAAASLLARFPVALLERTNGGSPWDADA